MALCSMMENDEVGPEIHECLKVRQLMAVGEAASYFVRQLFLTVLMNHWWMHQLFLKAGLSNDLETLIVSSVRCMGTTLTHNIIVVI